MNYNTTKHIAKRDFDIQNVCVCVYVYPITFELKMGKTQRGILSEPEQDEGVSTEERRESEPKLWKGGLGAAGPCTAVVQYWVSLPTQGQEGAHRKMHQAVQWRSPSRVGRPSMWKVFEAQTEFGGGVQWIWWIDYR